jgi:hypothetical protein
MEEHDDGEYPGWVWAVAAEVDKLVSQPAAMERFQGKVREWDKEFRATKLPDLRDYAGLMQPQYPSVRLVLVKKRASLPHKYATLAAIHDCVCSKTPAIDPWHTEGDGELEPADLPSAMEGTAFVALRARVDDLTDKDKARETIELYRSDVLADLGAVAGGTWKKSKKQRSDGGEIDRGVQAYIGIDKPGSVRHERFAEAVRLCTSSAGQAKIAAAKKKYGPAAIAEWIAIRLGVTWEALEENDRNSRKKAVSTSPTYLNYIQPPVFKGTLPPKVKKLLKECERDCEGPDTELGEAVQEQCPSPES